LYFKNGKKLENWWLEEVKEILEIKIPVWIKDDVYLKYSGRWDYGQNGMPAGDLYIQINITSNPYYVRKWDDIYINQEVNFYDLVLWWEYEINHPTGKLKIKIPKGTQVDESIRINWKGFGEWWVFSKRWDLFIVPKLKIPRRLTKEQEELWKKLQKSG
jgi:curved DNA-binding protein